MTDIRANCPSCGAVDLAAEAISMHLHPSGARGAFRFICPGCRSEVDRPANRKTLALLVAAGVEPPSTDAEEEPTDSRPMLPFEDRSPDPVAPPFTLDDVISFHFLMEDEDAIAEMLSLER